MNERRTEWVQKAFMKFDKAGIGSVNFDQLKDSYNARLHPEVEQKKRLEDDVLQEFLETFDVFHNDVLGKQKDANVTLEEFESYYANLSAVIEDDEEFVQIIKGTWELTEIIREQQKPRDEYEEPQKIVAE